MGSHTCTERPGHYTKPFITENMVISMMAAMVINKMMMVVSLMMPVMMVMIITSYQLSVVHMNQNDSPSLTWISCENIFE